MKTTISGRGMVSHVTGVPSSPSRIDPTFPQWQQADHCVFTWLIQNLDHKLISRMSQQPTAKHIWDSLEITYESGGDAIEAFDLHYKASTLKQRNNSLEDIWNTLQELWISIDQKEPNPMECPKDIDKYNRIIQTQRLYQFLRALDDKYEHTKREILKEEPLPSVEQAYNTVRREDTRGHVLRPGASDEKPMGDGIGAGLATRDRGRHNSIPSVSRNGGSGGGGCNR